MLKTTEKNFKVFYDYLQERLITAKVKMNNENDNSVKMYFAGKVTSLEFVIEAFEACFSSDIFK